MKLSIIIPAYNASKYIERCVESIISQDYCDVEILLVDDGSTDSTLEICQQLSRKHLNIKALHKNNGGVSSARNFGIDNAAGEYLMFADADDYLLPDNLKKAVEVAEKNSEADFCVFGYIRSARKGSETKANLPFRKYDKYEKLEYVKNVDTVTFGAMWSKLYKRSFITSNNLRFDTDIIASEDNCFNFKALEIANCIVTSELMVYYYDVNYQSATAKFIGEKYIDNAKKYLDIIYSAISAIKENNGEICKDNLYAEEIIEASQKTLCHNTLYQIYNIYRQKSNKNFKKYIWLKHLMKFMKEIKPEWQLAFPSGFPHVFATAYNIHPRCADMLLRTVFTVKR